MSDTEYTPTRSEIERAWAMRRFQLDEEAGRETDGLRYAAETRRAFKEFEVAEAERDAALARIAELEMTVTSASFEFHEQFERAEQAESRIAEAAKLHQPQPFHDEPSESFCKTCQRTAGVWPCETAVALGLNEGENEDE